MKRLSSIVNSSLLFRTPCCGATWEGSTANRRSFLLPRLEVQRTHSYVHGCVPTRISIFGDFEDDGAYRNGDFKRTREQQITIVLVVIATKTTYDALNDLPENCVVVTGPALKSNYSVFSARVNLLSKKSLSRINVNTATTSELMTIDKIGRSTGNNIIMDRKKNGYFTSWENLNMRVVQTRKCKEDIFSYELVTVSMAG
jgi:DNA uptake protein ComE-like DNA-binding protein